MYINYIRNVHRFVHRTMTISVFPGTIPELGIQLDTPEWFQWLSTQSRFSYEGNLTTMSVKRRASNGKWYARKKVYSSAKGSTPVDLYLGSDEEVTAEKLREINYRFGQDWVKFWEWYYSPARKESKDRGVHTQSLSTPDLGFLATANDTDVPGSRLTELERENRELRERLDLLQKKYEHEADCARRYYPNWRKFPGLESERNYFKSQRDKLQAELEELKRQLRSAKRYKLHGREVIQTGEFQAYLEETGLEVADNPLSNL